MKDLFKILLVAVGISVFITACDTDAEIKDPANLTDPDRSEQYYEQLRAYKQPQVWLLHSFCFWKQKIRRRISASISTARVVL